MSREEQHRLAMHLYAEALAIVDPIRIKMWSEAELTTSQLRILFMLHAEPGSPLGHLAAQLRVSPPTASGLVDRLVRQGYVRREEDAQDRRVVRHRLTERGQSVAGEIAREGKDLLEAIFSRLSEGGLATLIQGLTLLGAAAAACDATPAGAQ